MVVKEEPDQFSQALDQPPVFEVATEHAGMREAVSVDRTSESTVKKGLLADCCLSICSRHCIHETLSILQSQKVQKEIIYFA